MHAAGFRGRQIVNLARFAERTGIDVNQAGGIAADTVRIMGGGNAQEEERWRGLIDNYHADPGNAEARGRLLEELRRRQREGTEGQQNQAERHLNLIGQADQALTAANTATTALAAAQQQTDSGIDDLNGPPRGQPTLHVAGPR